MKALSILTAVCLAGVSPVHAQTPRPADMIDLDRPFDRYLWITAHNAANHGSLVPNQTLPVDLQLVRGVRGLMFDIYERDGRLFNCHADCAFHGRKAPLEEDLGHVQRFLDGHPEAVVTLQLEDYNSRGAMEAFARENPSLFALSFNPTDPRWRALDGRWPTLRQMIQAGQRLLVFTQRAELAGAYGGSNAWFMHDQDISAENYWSLGPTIFQHDYSCRPRWPGIPLDSTSMPLGFPRLFVMNHFHGVPLSVHAGTDNRLDVLSDRLRDQCLPAAGRMPAYLAVDFIEWGDSLELAETYNNGGVIAFADNAATEPVCAFSTAFDRSWSLTSTPRMGCEDNTIRALALRGARAGARIVLHHDANGARPGTVVDILQDVDWDTPQLLSSLDQDTDTPYLRVRASSSGPLDGRVSRITVERNPGP